MDPGRLAGIARQGRCEGIVYAALVAARDAIGATLPPGVLEALHLSPARARLLARLVTACMRCSGLDRPAHRSLAALLALASMRGRVAGRAILMTPRERLRSRRKRRRLGVEGHPATDR